MTVINKAVAEAPLTIDALNRMAETMFVEALADIYEHSPWIAAKAAAERPFVDTDDLVEAMAEIVLTADQEKQLALLNAHPELGQSGTLTSASTIEQRFAGFDRMTQGDAERLATLNRAYRTRFGFPFIIAVRGQKNAEAIIERLQQRLAHDQSAEAKLALDEVIRIANFRLRRRIHDPQQPVA
ncbi:2-oxo-4-hydroxy-4-carboxy-5-ureidoimidazoline decarboxylase [Acidiphilium sp. AL]|uniref:2-oxo-4-hydroxy-4-carboxy-5-ureidoimidazoline decarboxylase n=1 Tax=Acidiphilium sp. AL TaxID=2871704 RepID=UPI0021CB6B17|nr:2-oxo-4-hydroxy-4-carboxy-5-ureidoimidazoline decarboxylase [Acidiphilium sp. AL]MCU4160756.1 2-oxo-4-hydroxy-4-carboxy-5-ureidoimidazoline decarboxylase [Acidiphilium sp. AL]